MTTERSGSRTLALLARSGSCGPVSFVPDTLEIVIEETTPAGATRAPAPIRGIDGGVATAISPPLIMPWADLLALLTAERLAVLRQVRTDAAKMSGAAQIAALEWAGLVRLGADGCPSVPYREILVRIPL